MPVIHGSWTVIVRSWIAFAALGAGILHLGLVVGSPLPVAIALVPLGAAEFVWGVAVLVRGRFVLASATRAVMLVPVLGWSGLLVLGILLELPGVAGAINPLPMAVAVLFDCVVIISLSLALRSRNLTLPDAGPARAGPTDPPAGRYLVGLFVGGLVVSMLMTPALSLTAAGVNNPHANHGGIQTFAPELGGHGSH